MLTNFAFCLLLISKPSILIFLAKSKALQILEFSVS